MKKNFVKAVVFLIACMMLPFGITMLMTPDSCNTSATGNKVVASYNDTLSITDVEAFVLSGVAAYYEVGDSQEFLKALAVVIRTHAVYARNSLGVTDASSLGIKIFSENDMKNAWGDNYEKTAMLVEAAVVETAGMYIVSAKGEIILPYFHYLSSGYTRTGAYDWLVSVDCREDTESEEYIKTIEIKENDIKEKTETLYPQVLWEEPAYLSIQIVERDEAGYVVEVMVGNIILTGQEFTDIFGLNSPCFSTMQGKETITITTKGIGSGYGMSLYGSRQKALSGMKYEEIIYWFYKNCQLETE